MISQALALAIEASKSLARRRLRLSPAGKDLKPSGVVGTLDNVNGPVTKFGERVAAFLPA
jgi:hypothetical protein